MGSRIYVTVDCLCSDAADLAQLAKRIVTESNFILFVKIMFRYFMIKNASQYSLEQS